MENKDVESIPKARAELFKEHKLTSKYIAKLALTSTSTSMLFKLKLVRFYKRIFGSK